MRKFMITARIVALAVAAVTLASACTTGSGTPSARIGAASSLGASVTGPGGSAVPAVALTTVPLVVPKSEDAAPLNKPRTLQMPHGWTARAWARVPDARMEAWTPGGDLLVSQP